MSSLFQDEKAEEDDPALAACNQLLQELEKEEEEEKEEESDSRQCSAPSSLSLLVLGFCRCIIKTPNFMVTGLMILICIRVQFFTVNNRPQIRSRRKSHRQRKAHGLRKLY